MVRLHRALARRKRPHLLPAYLTVSVALWASVFVTNGFHI